MKFKNVTTGVILETNNEWTIKQMQDNENYKIVEETKIKEETKRVRKSIQED